MSSFYINLLLLPPLGIMLDIYGRRVVLSLSMFTLAVVYMFYPRAIAIWEFLGLRILSELCTSALLINPLVADYIKRDSRGKAIALINILKVLGGVSSSYLLLLTAQNVSIMFSFNILTVIIVLVALIMYLYTSDVK